jgi:hypothetical protein
MSFWPPWIIKFGFGFRALFRWLGGFYGSGFLTAKELGTVWFVMESDGFAATMSLGWVVEILQVNGYCREERENGELEVGNRRKERDW